MSCKDIEYRERLRDDGEKQADCEARKSWLDAHDAPLPPENPDRVQAKMRERVRDAFSLARNRCNALHFSDSLRRAKIMRLEWLWKEYLSKPSHSWAEFCETVSLIEST